jgi:galactokinase
LTELEVTASAPGRVNLIGEHTDYHDGFVLPTVLPQRTVATIRRRSDRRVTARSDRVDESRDEYLLGDEQRGRGWLDYVQGITAVLAARGLQVGGFDLRLTSTVPLGAGVSSSAALEVSVLRALREAFRLPLGDVDLARVAQAVETEFVGVPVGIMDQMASSLGAEGHALFLDTSTLHFVRVPLPPVDLVVIESGITHRHAGGGYITRRNDSFAAAELLGVKRLRDVGVEALARVDQLPPVLARRARHIITENQRVLDAVAALEAGDLPRLGALFNASHQSMRDDYEISTPAIDVLVALAQGHPDIYGARLTGGGFGGAVVMLAQRGTGRRAADAVRHDYQQLTSLGAAVLVPTA